MSKRRNRGNGEGSVYKRQGRDSWYITYYDANGRRKTHCTKTTDKAAAQRILAEKLADVALRRDGVIDARQEAIITESSKPIETHLASFEAMMQARQASPRHIKSTLSLIREVCKVAGFQIPNDITADGLHQVTAAIKAKGNGARTIQARVVAMKAFSKWLADHGKLAHDPLRSVKRPSVKADRRHRRRMLNPAEWPYLRSATLTSGIRDEMNPLERVALYATAIQTGLRSNELRSLTKADLFLSGEKPYVRCRGENTKNGNEARQYIQTDLAAELRALTANKTPSTPVFPMPDEFSVADMLREDLAAARKQWLDEVKHDHEALAKRQESDFLAAENHEGEKIDFHALRHSCGSWLALQGVHPNVIKTVMRHSTITLTMDTYGHLLPEAHADAIGGMPMMGGEMPLAATGTADREDNVAHREKHMAAVGIAVGTRNGAKPCEGMQEKSDFEEMGETLEFTRENAFRMEKKGSASCRARTYDPLIKSQLEHTENPGFSEVSEDGAAVRIAVGPKMPPDLAAVIDAWPMLPEALRAGILAMIRASGG